jgi:hypothetical protein
MGILVSIISAFFSGLAALWAYRSIVLVREANRHAKKSIEIAEASMAMANSSLELANIEAATLRRERLEKELIERFRLSRDTYAHQQSIQWAIDNGIRDGERIRQIIFRTAHSEDFDPERRDALMRATNNISDCIDGRMKLPYA